MQVLRHIMKKRDLLTVLFSLVPAPSEKNFSRMSCQAANGFAETAQTTGDVKTPGRRASSCWDPESCEIGMMLWPPTSAKSWSGGMCAMGEDVDSSQRMPPEFTPETI